MEIYTLDPLLRREFVIDKFESMIWAERYREFGDFQVVIHSTPSNRRLLQAGTRLAMNESHRVMTVETIEDTTDEDGREMLSVKGRSLEAFAKERPAEVRTMTDTPTAIVRAQATQSLISPIVTQDAIPYLEIGSFLPASSIPEPTETMKLEIDPQNAYDAIFGVCDTYDLGFHIVREYDTSQLWFDVYTGSDRTTSQGVNTPVVFAKNLGNLQNTKELTTIENTANVAYIYSNGSMRATFADGVDPEDLTGFDRRILTIVADDIDNADPDFEDLMVQRGKEALAQHRTYHAFDGQINQNSQYKYQKDYWLGDIVEMRGPDGVSNRMRVTEQIFSHDREGEMSYPTLTTNLYVTAGSWPSWLYKRTWVEFDETEFWANQP